MSILPGSAAARALKIWARANNTNKQQSSVSAGAATGIETRTRGKSQDRRLVRNASRLPKGRQSRRPGASSKKDRKTEREVGTGRPGELPPRRGPASRHAVELLHAVVLLTEHLATASVPVPRRPRQGVNRSPSLARSREGIASIPQEVRKGVRDPRARLSSFCHRIGT